MCGIFGLIDKKGKASVGRLKSLFLLSESRGKEAAGLAVRCNHKISIYKDNRSASSLLGTPSFASFMKCRLTDVRGEQYSVIGHCRLVTDGNCDDNRNNQPVIKDGHVVVHNGIVTNMADIKEKYRDSLKLEYEIDTEIIPSLYNLNLLSGDNPVVAIRKVFAEIRGTATIAMYLSTSSHIMLATNNASLYYSASSDDGVFAFASEKAILRTFRRRSGMLAEAEIRHLLPFTGVFVGIDDISLQDFAFDSSDESGVNFGRLESPCKIEDCSPVEIDGRRSLAQINIVEGEADLLEYNADRIDAMRRCSRCFLPESFPFIEYKDGGVCNFCLNHKKFFGMSKELKQRKEEQFLQILQGYRRPGKEPDVVVPFSGGRDSSYGLHCIVHQIGLKPITFTYDWGMVTDLARRNIARLCGKLGIENIIVSADIRKKRKFISQNVAAWLKSPDLGIIPIFMAGDKYFRYHVNVIKKQTGIELNIWMGNRLEDTAFKYGLTGVAPDSRDKKFFYKLSHSALARQALYYMKAYIANPRYFNSSLFDTVGAYYAYYLEPRKDTYMLYDYLDWDEHRIISTLVSEYGWELSPDTKSSWRIGDGTASFYNYIYYTVAGFSEIDTFRCNQIREGMLSREDAFQLARDENRPRYESIKWYLDIIGIDYKYAIRTINRIPKLY